jgi:hypothetical protein
VLNNNHSLTTFSFLGANLSAESLSDVSQEVNTLKSLGNNVTTKITNIKANLANACTVPLTNTCPNTSDLSLGASFSGVINDFSLSVENPSKFVRITCIRHHHHYLDFHILIKSCKIAQPSETMLGRND